jgi:multidrug efflux pump subunit AcrA (membrane-fusion protein)
MGQQDLARREWELLGENERATDLERELALRQPHLARVTAARQAAEADLELAKLNRDRTIITAPFNAVVKSRSIELGAQVMPQDKLAELVDTDVFWVRVSVPMDRLKWIDIPRTADDPGASATIFYGTDPEDGQTRTGKVIRLLSDLEPQGRMARLLVEVPDPLGLKRGAPERPPLLLGAYVRVEIAGRTLENAVRIPRSALRENSRIWLLDDANQLEIREVQPAWREAETVLLQQGLIAGERLIVSDLSLPVAGMKLRLPTDAKVDQPVVVEDETP